MYGHAASEITKITVVSPGLMIPPRQPLPSAQAEARPIPRSRIGKARSTSIKRESAVSTQPR